MTEAPVSRASSLSGDAIAEKIEHARSVRGLSPTDYETPYHSIPHLLSEQTERNPSSLLLGHSPVPDGPGESPTNPNAGVKKP